MQNSDRQDHRPGSNLPREGVRSRYSGIVEYYTSCGQHSSSIHPLPVRTPESSLRRVATIHTNMHRSGNTDSVDSGQANYFQRHVQYAHSLSPHIPSQILHDLVVGFLPDRSNPSFQEAPCHPQQLPIASSSLGSDEHHPPESNMYLSQASHSTAASRQLNDSKHIP